MKEAIQAILDKKEVRRDVINKPPTSFDDLKSIVMQMELAQEIDAVRKMLNNDESFEEQLMARCHWRSSNKTHCISYQDMNDSPAHQLYLKIAKLVFQTSSESELTTILSLDKNESQQSNKLLEAESSKPLFPSISALEIEYAPSNPFISKSNATNTTEEQSLSLPSEYVKTAFQNIKIKTAQELIQILLNYPPKYYEMLWANIELTDPEQILAALALFIRDGLFDSIQSQALAKAIAENYDRFGLTTPMMMWALKTICYDINLKIAPSFLVALLSCIENEKRLDAICSRDKQGVNFNCSINPLRQQNALLSIYQLLPINDRLEAILENLCIHDADYLLSRRADLDLSAYEIFLGRGKREQGVESLVDLIKNSKNHFKAKPIYENFELTPEEERLEWLKSIDFSKYTILMNSEYYFKKILLSLSEQEQFVFLRLPTVSGYLYRWSCEERAMHLKIKISSTDKGFEKSFIPNYLAINTFIYHNQYNWGFKFIKSFKDNPIKLRHEFDEKKSFEEVKQLIEDHISKRPKSSLSKGLKERLSLIVYDNEPKNQPNDYARISSLKDKKRASMSSNVRMGDGKKEKEPTSKTKFSPVSLMDSPSPTHVAIPLQPTAVQEKGNIGFDENLNFFPKAPIHDPEVERPAEIATYF